MVLALFSLITLVFIVYVLYIFISFQKYTNAFKLPPIDTNQLAKERLKYIGKEITLDPKSILVKVENYGGPELDKYFHLIHVDSDVVTRYQLKVEKDIKLEKSVKFRVIGVEFRNSNVDSYFYCLLESSEFPGQVAQHNCDKLDKIPEP